MYMIVHVHVLPSTYNFIRGHYHNCTIPFDTSPILLPEYTLAFDKPGSSEGAGRRLSTPTKLSGDESRQCRKMRNNVCKCDVFFSVGWNAGNKKEKYNKLNITVLKNQQVRGKILAPEVSCKNWAANEMKDGPNTCSDISKDTVHEITQQLPRLFCRQIMFLCAETTKQPGYKICTNLMIYVIKILTQVKALKYMYKKTISKESVLKRK